MWGNTTGWLLSVVLVILTLALGAKIRSYSAITDATDFSTGANIEALAVPVPDDVVSQTESGDGAAMYLLAIKNYKEGAVAAFVDDPTGTPPQSIQLILDATHKSQNAIFTTVPAELVNFDSDHDALTILKDIGEKTINSGIVLMNKGNKDQARKYLEAAFALGAALERERLTHEEFFTGETLTEGAIEELAKVSPDHADQYNAELAALKSYDAKMVEPIYRVLMNINLKEEDFHAGDIYRFALESKDRMVRVEAILALGRMRWFASHITDQEQASKTAAKIANNDPDPIIVTAAKAARDLTVEQYRMIH